MKSLNVDLDFDCIWKCSIQMEFRNSNACNSMNDAIEDCWTFQLIWSVGIHRILTSYVKVTACFFSIDISFHECILYACYLSHSMIWTVRFVCPPAPIFELRFISDVELKKNKFSQFHIPKWESQEIHMIFFIFKLLITYTKDIHTRTMWTQIICFEIPLKYKKPCFNRLHVTWYVTQSFTPPNWTRYSADNVSTLRLEGFSITRLPVESRSNITDTRTPLDPQWNEKDRMTSKRMTLGFLNIHQHSSLIQWTHCYAVILALHPRVSIYLSSICRSRRISLRGTVLPRDLVRKPSLLRCWSKVREKFMFTGEVTRVPLI